VVLFDFSDPAACRGWGPVDDRVMGGVSRSSIAPSGDGTAVFSGTVSKENSGGFASVRSGTLERAPELCEGVELRLLTDGKSYKVNLRTDDRFDGFQYQARIRCDGGAWSTVRIPFLEFTPVLRGRPVAGVAPLEPANLSGVGLMISEGQEGSFRLEIRTISAYRKV
jgi:NADH dehydrogenase [ubiquinone] 1 alpha subcomplex assembly factor 1